MLAAKDPFSEKSSHPEVPRHSSIIQEHPRTKIGQAEGWTDVRRDGQAVEIIQKLSYRRCSCKVLRSFHLPMKMPQKKKSSQILGSKRCDEGLVHRWSKHMTSQHRREMYCIVVVAFAGVVMVEDMSHGLSIPIG